MYQSLYRKYRPQTFSEIYGQDAISTTLTNAIIHDRVAHAYLFSGPRGTGKTSTAKLLAKALNCTNIIDGRICDECENCQLTKNNAHPDVIEIDAASNNGVEEVRDLIEKVKYAPIKGRKKVYIIDEIHMMSQGAFNALLKTLEEPPEHVVFILATTEHHKVPETIKSRCQRFNFKKLSNEDIVARLKDILTKEQASYDKTALITIASQSDGGMRDAIGMLEQALIYSNNNITIELVNEALDLVSKDKIKKLFDLILTKQLSQVLEYLEGLSKSSIDYKQIINEIIKLAIEHIIDLKVNMSEVAKQEFLLNLIEKFDEANDKLKFDNSKRLYLELAILKSINYQKEIININEEIENNTILSNEEVIVTRRTFDQEYVSTTTKESSENQALDEQIQPSDSFISKVSEQATSTMNQNEQALFNNISIEEELEDQVVDVIDANQVSMDIFNDLANQEGSFNEIETLNKTSETSDINESIELVNDEEILNVLVQASRDELNLIKEKWEILSDYLMNKNTKKSAALLIDSIPVAASEGAIIVVVNQSVEVTLINDLENIQMNANFFASILDKPRYCFALDKKEWLRMKDKYLELRRLNSLPQPRDILENHKFEEVVLPSLILQEDEENLRFAKMIFKDKLEIKREEE